MRLQATIVDYQTDVRIRDEGPRVSTEIEDRVYDLEVHKSGGSYLLIHNGQVFECRVEGRPESGKTVDVIVGTTQYAVTLTDPRRLRGASGMAAHADEAALIIAPMPGKVVRVMVEVGDVVTADAGILVVEAMKMQNEMKSPKAGTVVALNVQAGATVNSGDVLAVVE
jgi:biotin carboxyl carrier protein